MTNHLHRKTDDSHEHVHDSHDGAHDSHDDAHEHGHSHAHVHKFENSKALLLTVFFNLFITALEIAGGLLSGSLALISDALHNFSDSSALFISYFAIRISRRQADAQKTFGYQRIEILAANLNASILFIISFFLFREAIGRFFNPQPVNTLLMFTVAIAGLLGNLISVIVLHNRVKENINIRSAYIHLFSDTISSVAVIAGGLVMYFFKIYWLDPVLTLGIGLYVLIQSFFILFETANILMQSAPKNIDLEKLKKEVEGIEGVNNLHHVHVWRLSDKDVFFDGHIEIEKEIEGQAIDIIRRRVETVLTQDFKVTHTTLQLSYYCCEEKPLIANRLHNDKTE
jgi:cobalt-zinc-cadmium efflux system protein